MKMFAKIPPDSLAAMRVLLLRGGEGEMEERKGRDGKAGTGKHREERGGRVGEERGKEGPPSYC